MELTTEEKRSKFKALLFSGKTQTEAARGAGYAFPAVAAAKLMQQKSMMEELHAELMTRVQTEGQVIAFTFLINTIKNEKAPWSARTECARIVANKGPLSDTALKSAYQPGDKPLSDMTLPELEQFIQGGIAALDKAKQAKALPGDFQDVTAQQIPIDAPK